MSTSRRPYTLTINRMPVVPGTARYGEREHIVTLYARNLPDAQAMAYDWQWQLHGQRNVGGSSQGIKSTCGGPGVRYVTSDPTGARWECYELLCEPAVLDTGKSHDVPAAPAQFLTAREVAAADAHEALCVQFGARRFPRVHEPRRFAGPAPAMPTIDDLTAVRSEVRYNGPAHYFRAVAAEAWQILANAEMDTRRGLTPAVSSHLDAIDVAFGVTPTGNAGAWTDLSDEPTADEVAVVGAILAAIG
jgi:hypothetical protein